MLDKTQIKLKPWGREIWFAHVDTPTAKYAGKILEVKKGHRYSLQYHEKKQETQYILSGKALFTFGIKKDSLQEKILNKGDKINVLPYTIHRLEAIEDTVVFEVSSPELDDVVKIKDDYGRSGKGNDEKLDEKLAEKDSPAKAKHKLSSQHKKTLENSPQHKKMPAPPPKKI